MALNVRQVVSKKTARSLMLGGVAVFAGLWCLLSYGGLVPSVILPSPTDVLKAFPVLHFEEALVRSAIASFYRVMMGFLLAAVVAIPLGLVMGTFPPVKHFFAPVLDPLRFLPISALVPLFIVWCGIEDLQKIRFLRHYRNFSGLYCDLCGVPVIEVRIVKDPMTIIVLVLKVEYRCFNLCQPFRVYRA